MSEATREILMTKWAFSVLKPHLKNNIKTKLKNTDEPNRILVVFSGYTPTQEKNILDISEWLSVSVEKSMQKQEASNPVKSSNPESNFVLEDVVTKPSQNIEVAPTEIESLAR